MEIASSVDEVLVWRRGATVTRRTDKLALSPGQRTIALPGLPLALLDGSVRVTVEGVASVRVTSVRVTLHAAPREDLPPEPDTVRRKEALRQLVRARRDLAQVQAERALLQSFAVPERPSGEEGKPPPPSPMYARVALDGFVDEGTAARDLEIQTLSHEIVRLTEEVAAQTDAVARRDAAMRARPDEITKAVVATLTADAEIADAVLVLRYQVQGARWAPVYQIHVDGSGSKAKMVMRAVVAQATGESWRSVKLVLSTALPEAFTELPVLRAMRIGKAQAPGRAEPAFRAPPAGAERLFADFDREQGQLAYARPVPRSLASSPYVPDLPALFGEDQGEMMLERERGIVQESRKESEAYGDMDDYNEIPPGMGGGGAGSSRAALADRLQRGPVGAAPPRPSRTPEAKKVARSAPAPERRARRRRSDEAEEEPSPIEDVEEESSVDSTVPSTRLPAFAGLMLADASSSERGRLALRSTDEAWLQGLSRPVAFDVLAHVHAMEAVAVHVFGLAMPDGTEPVDQSTGRFDYAYRADDRLDLPSDGGWHTVPVVAREGSCALRYVVVPRQDVSVFRVATLKNPLAQPLLAGPVEVYVAGAFQLTSRLPTVAPGESVELGMGVEPAIRCARNASFEEKRSGERVVAMTELHHTVTIELRNGLARDAPIEVRERIPQPAKDAEVAIDEEAVAPAWEAYPQRERQHPLKGGRRWKITLPKSGSTVLTAKYVVRIYANNEVVGGNRREA